MPIPAAPLRRGDRGPEVASLHRTFESLDYVVDQSERDSRSFGPGTEELMRRFQGQSSIEGSGEFDIATRAVIEAVFRDTAPFCVYGKLSDANGEPIAGASIIALDMDFRRHERLKKAPTVTDRWGEFEARYSAASFTRAEKGNADLVVRALRGTEELLAESKVMFNAPAETRIDLIAGVRVGSEAVVSTEYERYMSDLEPVLAGVALLTLDAEPPEDRNRDLDFLAGETGIARERIVWLVQASKFEDESRVRPDVIERTEARVRGPVDRAQTVPAEVFYGCFRRGLSSDLSELLAQADGVLRDTLEAAARDQIIRSRTVAEMDQDVASLRALRVRIALQPNGGAGQLSLGDLLHGVLPDPIQQQAFAELYLDQSGAYEDRWKAVEDARVLPLDTLRTVRTSIELGPLTNQHLPLIRQLQSMANDEPSLRELRGLSRLTGEEWEQLLLQPQADGTPIGFPAYTPGSGDTEKRTNYAKELSTRVANRFPTAVLARRLELESAPRGPFAAAKADFKAFFAGNVDFEFGKTPVSAYLARDRSRKLGGVKEPEQLISQLKSIERVVKLAPQFEKVEALLADGLHSAQSIVLAGKLAFVERHAHTFGGEQRALEVYARAEEVHLTAVNLYAKHGAAFNSPWPYVMSGNTTRGGSSERASQARSNISNWVELFGSLDICECADCQSLNSPAAYFVDTLQFLKQGPATSGRTALQALLSRRPDLEQIELTCENSNTELPYVDLVNEVLEQTVAPLLPRVFPLTADAITRLNRKELPQEVNELFRTIGYPMGAEVQVIVDKANDAWAIRDDRGIRWSLKSERAQLTMVAESARKTPAIALGNATVEDLDRQVLSPDLVSMVRKAAAFVGAIRDPRLEEEVRQAEPMLTLGQVIVVQAGQSWLVPYDVSLVLRYTDPGLSVVRGAQEVPLLFRRGVNPPLEDLERGLYPEALNEALMRVIVLSTTVTVTVVNPRREWRLTCSGQVQLSLEKARLSIASMTFQTRGTEDELCANPEHVIPAAYEVLKSAVYPWSLPLHLWLEEGRLYLHQLGVQRHQLMAVVSAPDDVLRSIAIAREHLGLSLFEAQLVTGGLVVRVATTENLRNLMGDFAVDGVPAATLLRGRVLVKDQTDPSENGIYTVQNGGWVREPEHAGLPNYVVAREGATNAGKAWLLKAGHDNGLTILPLGPWDFWGLQEFGNSLADPDDLTPSFLTGRWDLVLSRVSTFVRRSALSYRDLLALLATRFVNPPDAAGQRPLGIAAMSGSSADAASCDLSALVIAGLTPSALDRIHRFVRIAHKLAWSFSDLDKAISALSPQGLTAAFLRQLSHIRRIQGRQTLPLVNVLAWWATIDTEISVDPDPEARKAAAPLYDRLFLNKNVHNPVDPAFALSAARDELETRFEPTAVAPDPTTTIAAHASAIAAALGISSAELTLMLNGLASFSLRSVVDDQLTLANLSTLYRHASLAKFLRLPIRDLLTLKALLSVDPFQAPAGGTASESTLRFIELVDFIRASPFTISELDYVLRHQFLPESSILPTGETYSTLLTQLRATLQGLRSADGFAADPNREQLLQSAVVSCLSEALALTADVIELLLTTLLKSPSVPAARLLDTFLDPLFLATDARQ
ncbi:MAG TPA: Tc toxin subunit A, partial [Gemmatimonadaceae bacterium]|nr:Tc toxin subunit A [Gemmatimonadaceae bacterium]